MCIYSNDTATTEIYTLSLHDALPIWDWIVHADDGDLNFKYKRKMIIDFAKR